MLMTSFLVSLRSRWVAWLATALAVAVIAAAGWFLLLRGTVLRAQSGMNCSGQYLVDKTLPTGARWEMCWEHRQAEGIVFHDIYYTPTGGARRKVLAQANVAQIHVPYDDNGARFHDLSDFGLGETRMNALTQADCPNGALLSNAGKNVLCMQIEPRGYAYKYYDQQLQGYELSLFSVSHIGQYNYIPVWRFADDGAIEPTMGATGRLQRLEYNASAYGWLVRSDGGGGIYAISHIHNYYWRLDFDIDGPNNDLVEEFEFTPTNGNAQYAVSVNPLTTESARTVNPTRMRSWRVRDTVTKNSDGHPISYHLEPMRVGHIHQGPVSEPFTNNQFYVTVNKACEKWVSHNPTINCADNLSAFVNGESLVGQDIVVWYGITFHHLPRDEDEGMMDAHWDGFQIIPRDWTATNPLDNVVLGPTATPTNTPVVVPPTPTNTPVFVPPTPTNTPVVVPPTPTNTPVVVPPTATNTPVGAPPTATNTPVGVPPTATNTPVGVPPTATNTPVGPPPTATPIGAPPTATPAGTPGTVACYVFESTDIPKPLPRMQSSVSSSISVPADLLVTDVNVSLYVTHTYVGDIGFVVQHLPSARSVAIIDRPGMPASTYGCPNDDINAILDDEATQPAETTCAQTRPTINGPVQPNNPLSAFDGINAAGSWVLTFTDYDVVTDSGALRNWGLQICGTTVSGTGVTDLMEPGLPFGYDVPIVPVDGDDSPPRVDFSSLTNPLFLPQISN